MVQKTGWLRYLLIGISLVCLGTRCGKDDVEYRMTIELTFINATDSLISFQLRQGVSLDALENVMLMPQSQSKFFTYDIEGVDKTPKPETCCQAVLENSFVTSSANVIMINNTSCVTHRDTRSAVLANYSVEIISERYFRYTYTFTEDDLDGDGPCN